MEEEPSHRDPGYRNRPFRQRAAQTSVRDGDGESADAGDRKRWIHVRQPAGDGAL